MEQNVFSIGIRAPNARKFIRDGHTYVALSNYSEYKIYISNEHYTRCDAEVHVDGETVGTWVIQPHSSVTIDRPANVAKKFTFVEETSDAARRTGAVVGSDLNGLVSVIFKPAKMEPVYTSLSTLRAPDETTSSLRKEGRSASPSRKSFASGVTVLGDRSQQTFGTERALTNREIDWALTTEVSLRLVVEQPPRIHYPPRLD